jgi:hypothetical protein
LRRQIGNAERVAQPLPDPVIAAPDRQPTIQAGKESIGCEPCMGIPSARFDLSRHRASGRVVRERGGLDLHHIHDDFLPSATALPM